MPEGQLRDGAIAFARQVLAEGRPLRKVRDSDDKLLAARGKPELFADFRAANAKRFRGLLAPEYNIRCIEAAVNLPFDEGKAVERKYIDFMAVMDERVCDGYYYASSFKYMKMFMHNPALLEVPPEKVVEDLF